jgi:very-short-patch-repair endonuclease
LGRDAIKRRLRSGALHRVHPGVYRVGHEAPSTLASYMAAVLACGPGAALSGMAAAHLYGLVRQRQRPEVTAPNDRRVEGVLTHRIRLHGRDVTEFKGIPVTTVPRTIVDIAGHFGFDPLAELCHHAQIRYRVRPRVLYSALSRCPNAKGAANLHRIFRGDGDILLSDLERRFLALLRKARLPLPRTNRPAGGRYVDCRWPEHKLTVELDSYTYHHTRHAWEQDRRREREARVRGDEFRRYTWDDVKKYGDYVLRDLQPLLTLRVPPSPSPAVLR